MSMDRREFLKKTLIAGGIAGAGLLFKGGSSLFSQTPAKGNVLVDLVAIKGGEPAAMFDLGIKALGGMQAFVKKGQTVVVKPNIGWNRTPEYGANTSPALVKRIIEQCYNAGAKKVYVFDNSCDFWEDCYKNSGIERAAKDGGATVAPANSKSYYQLVDIKDAKILKSTMVHELILSSDVFINVPVIKHHGSSRLTLAMKNLMGIVYDRGFYHSNGLSQSIADFCLYRKPDLNVIDGYTVLTKNGPKGRNPADVITPKYQILSRDIVAADSAAAKVFGVEPADIPHIKIADEMKLGTMNLDKLNIKRLTA
jgi:uncharacterized protein (DUF362 family)